MSQPLAGAADLSGAPAALPRFPLLHGPTPLHEMPRLREALGGARGCPRLLVKRDDLAGPALGGNKARKLEWVVGDALARGATHLITVGAAQSNHARMTAAAARLAGLGCTLVLTSADPEPAPEGNLLLDRMLGADVQVVAPSEESVNPHERAAIHEVEVRVRRAGGTPYVIPLGASNAIGTIGYVEAVRELEGQLAAMEVRADRLFYAAGSRGTQAGLLLGARLLGSAWSAHGVAVSPGEETKRALAASLMRDAAALLGADLSTAPAELAAADQDQIGEGYAIPTPAGMEAIRLLARTEAILLDPTYTGKAMAGLIDQIRRGAIPAHETVVFLHTGGAPALFRSGLEF